MLKIINKISPFFEDNYREIHVREYAKLIQVSPPTASKILQNFLSQKLLTKEVDKEYHMYTANRDSDLFRDLQKTYWKQKLKPLIKHFDKETINPLIILFGSVSKAEIREDSDIDIVVFTSSRKNISVNKFEKQLGRDIQVFLFKQFEDVPNNLQKSILNGFVLKESW